MQRTALVALMGALASLLTAGCDGHAPQPTETSAAQVPASSAGTVAGSGSASGGVASGGSAAETANAAARSGTPRAVKVDNDLYSFEYAYPAQAGAIPELRALLDKRAQASRAELEAGARRDRAEAAKDDYPYRPHGAGTEWKVVTDLPRWLSLSASRYEYSGGAHGMSFSEGLVWDREQGIAREASDFFLSKPALSSAIRKPFCAALDKERAKRRQAAVNRNSGDQFDECIDPIEHAMILGSSNGRTFDRIGILVEPYAAGPYAEGMYEITLPVTPAVLAVVKPAYKSAFSAR